MALALCISQRQTSPSLQHHQLGMDLLSCEAGAWLVRGMQHLSVSTLSLHLPCALPSGSCGAAGQHHHGKIKKEVGSLINPPRKVGLGRLAVTLDDQIWAAFGTLSCTSSPLSMATTPSHQVSTSKIKGYIYGATHDRREAFVTHEGHTSVIMWQLAIALAGLV